MEFIKVTGPAGKPVLAKYGIICPTNPDMEETNTAIMEMSQAAGITQVIDKERNPLYTTTYGVGQMIADAIYKGCRRFIMGIGGSATNAVSYTHLGISEDERKGQRGYGVYQTQRYS